MPFRRRDCGHPLHTMGEQQRVTFRFDGDTEVQYLSDLPSLGDRVTHEHELWVVTSVDTDPVGPFVICERATLGQPAAGRLLGSLR